MRRLCGVLAAWCLVGAGTSARAAEGAPPVLQVGREAPWIAAFDAQDNPLSLAALTRRKGTRGVVTQLWASWCRPCVDELRLLSEAKEKLDAAGITVFLVNLAFSEEGEGSARLVKELRLERFALAYDRTGAVAEAVGLTSDADGRLQLPLTIAVNTALDVRLVLRKAPKDYVGAIFAALRDQPVRP